MGQYNLFFNGNISKGFDGHKKLYLGDKDFVFADDCVNITGEIKTISKSYTFEGKRLTLNQAREYASMVDLKDNYGRICKSFLFEEHKYLKNPYVIVTPFKKPEKTEKKPMDYLDLTNQKMLYIDKHDQLNKWLAGDRYVGVKPTKPLLCINYK